MANTIFTLSPDTRRVVSELKTLMLSKKGITQLTYLQQPEVVIADLPEEESSPSVENNSDSVVINKPVSAYDNESKFPYAIPDATLNTCPTKGY